MSDASLDNSRLGHSQILQNQPPVLKMPQLPLEYLDLNDLDVRFITDLTNGGLGSKLDSFDQPGEKGEKGNNNLMN